MILKYYFNQDYVNLGTFTLFKDEIHIELNNQKEVFQCSQISIVLHYNSVRGKGFHFIRKDYGRSGISEIELDNQHFKVLISSEKQLEDLKKILASWYQKNYSVSEFMRTVEQNRLKELEFIK